jgi:hypothetical protein
LSGDRYLSVVSKAKLFAFIDPKPFVFAAALILIGIAAFGITILAQQSSRNEESWKPTQAKIVRFGVIDDPYNTRLRAIIIVTAETRDGLKAQAMVRSYQVNGCAVGDSVPAIRNGKSLKLKPRPC